MGILLTIFLTAVTLLVIYMNLVSWPLRILWFALLVASLVLLPGSLRLLGPFSIMVVLSLYQSIKNRGQTDDN